MTADPFPWAAEVQPWYRFHLEALVAGRFLLQRCDSCGRLQHPPTARCPECFSGEQASFAPSGDATVIASTIVRGSAPTTGPPVPYAACIVELTEGPRVYALCPDLDAVPPAGASVTVTVEDLEQIGPAPCVRGTSSKSGGS